MPKTRNEAYYKRKNKARYFTIYDGIGGLYYVWFDVTDVVENQIDLSVVGDIIAKNEILMFKQEMGVYSRMLNLKHTSLLTFYKLLNKSYKNLEENFFTNYIEIYCAIDNMFSGNTL